MLQSVVRRADQAVASSVDALSVRTAFPALLFLAVLLIGAPRGFGQALPAAEAAPISTGFSLPHTAGTLTYGVSASESLLWGYYGSGTTSATNVTGDVGYLSNSKLDPFSAVFSGGYSWGTGNAPSYTFLNLGLSQVLNAGRWNFTVSDSISYLPETAATGLSGVPGVGDLGVPPVQVGGIDTGQGLLTNFSTRVGNTASGSLQRQITGKTSIDGTGTYSIIRFLDNTGNTSNSGLDSSSWSGGGGFSHQVNERNSWGGNYSYADSSYSGETFGIPAQGFTSQTASLVYSHKFTRKFLISLAGGPQFLRLDGSGSSQSVSAYANAAASYTGRFSYASLVYSRSSNAGYGVVGGALSDNVSFSVGRTFARVWSLAATASYARNTSLPTQMTSAFAFDTTLGGVQVSRAIMRSLSVYASYTAENQSNTRSAAAVDVFSGLNQVVGFGLTYAPSSIHLGRQ